MLADNDKDGDGSLSSVEQRRFLEEFGKVYAIDLSEEMARAEAHPEEWQQAYEAQQSQTQQEMLANPQEPISAYGAKPSDVMSFFVATIAGVALTTLGIQLYRKRSR